MVRIKKFKALLNDFVFPQIYSEGPLTLWYTILGNYIFTNIWLNHLNHSKITNQVCSYNTIFVTVNRLKMKYVPDIKILYVCKYMLLSNTRMLCMVRHIFQTKVREILSTLPSFSWSVLLAKSWCKKMFFHAKNDYPIW